MDALKAFAYSVNFFGADCVRVRRLNGANSVWECRAANEVLGVLKSYPLDEHGWLHFKSEVDFLQANAHIPFVPHLSKVDFRERFAFVRFYQRSANSAVALNDILAALDEQVPRLNLPETFHHEPPGILGWWRQGGRDLGPSQSALLEFARSQSWFARSGEMLESAWQPQIPIHGDVKISNVVLEESTFKVLDWELIGLGLPGWDAAGLIQSCLSEAMRESEDSAWAMQNMQAVRAWLDTADNLMRAAVSVRLVQTAIESAQKRVPAPLHAAGLLQLAADVSDGDWSRIKTL